MDKNLKEMIAPRWIEEQRRYEIARDVLAAYLSNSNDRINSGSPQSFAKDAIELADALIEELKK